MGDKIINLVDALTALPDSNLSFSSEKLHLVTFPDPNKTNGA